jgi:RNA polymerase sigma-54 factor
MQSLSKYQKEKAEKLIKQIELINKRKSTLYLTLEILIQVQSKYFKTGDPEDRVPFSQKRLAEKIGVHPSVINRLISNKSIQVSWGEIPISILLPSSKVINLQRLYNIAIKNPEMTDLQLALELKRQYGINLSRRSIAQYRKELNLNKNSR